MMIVIVCNNHIVPAQKNNLQKIKLNKLVENYWDEIRSAITNLRQDAELGRLNIYNNRNDRKKIEIVRFEEYIKLKSNPIKQFDSTFTVLEETFSVDDFNNIIIHDDGFEFSFSTHGNQSFKYYNDTSFIVFFIDNENLKKCSNKFLIEQLLYFYQKRLLKKGVKHLNSDSLVRLVSLMQTNMIQNVNKNVLYVSPIESIFIYNDSLNNLLKKAHCIIYSDTAKFEENWAFQYESPLILDYEVNSKKNRLNINYIGFGFCLEGCYKGGAVFPFENYVIKRKKIYSILSKEYQDLLFTLIDYNLNRACSM